MYGPEGFRMMAGYNSWMNERLYEICAEITDEERKRDRGAFFRSIHGTLNHLLLADRAWLGRFTAHPVTFPSLDHELYAAFDDLRRERSRTDTAIEAFCEALDDADLAKPLDYATTAGKRFSHPLAPALAHMFNHQAHHRGQLTTLLSQSGIDPGVTDLVWFYRDQLGV